MSLTITVQANVRAELSHQSKSVNETAIRLGVSRQTISSKLNGHSAFSFDELDKLAAWLQVSPEQFFIKTEPVTQVA